MSKAFWNYQEDAKLINFVRQNEALYNQKCKNHRNVELKHMLWGKIAKILNKTDGTCIKRWTYVRDYYIRRRGKNDSFMGKQARMRCELLKFLDNRSLKDDYFVVNLNLEDMNEMIDDEDDNNKETKFKQESEDYEIEKLDSDEGESDNKVDYNNVDYSNVDYSNVDYNNVIEMKHNITSEEQDVKNFKRKSLMLKSQVVQNEWDETDLFFGSMAKIVKRLPRVEQVRLRMEIGSLVGNAELRCIPNDESQDRVASRRRSSSGSREFTVTCT